MNDPDHIGIAGDWHGNTQWATSAIRQICERLPGENYKIILQAGDFGISSDTGEFTFARETRHRQTYLEAVSETLEKCNARLWFVDGNHEDHPHLAELTKGMQDDDAEVSHRIRHLRRGYRWQWHDRTWLAMGGAVSVDKLIRLKYGPGHWFAEETITDEQEAAAIAGGPADVILSHDAPAEAPLRLMRPAPLAWQPMIAEADEHREKMQRICCAVKPSYIFHGHYHQSNISTVRTAWGSCRFTALDMNGRRKNWGILDARTMEWKW